MNVRAIVLLVLFAFCLVVVGLLTGTAEVRQSKPCAESVVQQVKPSIIEIEQVNQSTIITFGDEEISIKDGETVHLLSAYDIIKDIVIISNK